MDMSRTHSAKEDTPSSREYRTLRRAAREDVDHTTRDTNDIRLECQFTLRLMGELGLRAGELVHVTEDWVNFDQNTLEIPSHDQCQKGRDGGPCGYCKQQAKTRASSRENETYETALREYWRPKNEASSRRIWFGWDESLVEIIDEYLYKHDEYPHSRASANRRIDRIAEACEMVDKEDVYPHALRGHAAKLHAGKGMRSFQLKEFMGWSDVDGAMDYIKMAADDVETELRRIHGRPFGG